MSFIRFQLPAILYAIAIFVLSSIPDKSISIFPIFSQDKLLHIGEYFVFAMLLHRALRHQSAIPMLAEQAERWTILLATAYGITDELHQGFVPGRMVDAFDAAANAIGALLFVFIYRRFLIRIPWVRRSTPE